MVPLLNALRLGRGDLEEPAEAFAAEREAAGVWLQFHRAYSLDAQDEEDLENLDFLLKEVDSALDDLSLDRIVPPLYQAVALMDQIGKRREQPRFSQQPGVNDFIMAAAAWISGRGEKRGVLERMPVLEEYYKNLRHLYRLRQDDLKPELRPDFETGLKHFKASIEEARKALDRDHTPDLHDAIAHLGESAEVMQHLIDWDRQDQARHVERYRRFNIPMGGPDLELALETGRAVPRAQWERGIRNLTGLVLPKIFAFWNLVRGLMVLPVEQRVLLEEVDAGLEQLQSCVGSLLSRELTAEEALAEYEAACLELHNLFSQVERHARRGDRLDGTPAGGYWQIAMGVLGGTVPMVAMEELMRTVPAPAGVGPLFEEYLRSLDPECLREALCLLADSSPVVASEAVSTTWGCAYCGFVNPLGQHPCRRCGASPSASASWEA